MKTKTEQYTHARWLAQASRQRCGRKVIVEGHTYTSGQLQQFTHLDFYVVLPGMTGDEDDSREHYPDHEALARSIEEHAEAILERAAEISEARVEPARLEALEDAKNTLAMLEGETDAD